MTVTQQPDGSKGYTCDSFLCAHWDWLLLRSHGGAYHTRSTRVWCSGVQFACFAIDAGHGGCTYVLKLLIAIVFQYLCANVLANFAWSYWLFVFKVSHSLYINWQSHKVAQPMTCHSENVIFVFTGCRFGVLCALNIGSLALSSLLQAIWKHN